MIPVQIIRLSQSAEIPTYATRGAAAVDLRAMLDARGVLVVLDAVHQCVTTRGGRQSEASTLTIAARGELADPAARAEIIALLTGSTP